MMRPNHLDPDEALAAFSLLSAAWMVPIHYQPFLHSLDEPGDVERALDVAVARAPDLAARVRALPIGGSFDVRATIVVR